MLACDSGISWSWRIKLIFWFHKMIFVCYFLSYGYKNFWNMRHHTFLYCIACFAFILVRISRDFYAEVTLVGSSKIIGSLQIQIKRCLRFFSCLAHGFLEMNLVSILFTAICLSWFQEALHKHFSKDFSFRNALLTSFRNRLDAAEQNFAGRQGKMYKHTLFDNYQ